MRNLVTVRVVPFLLALLLLSACAAPWEEQTGLEPVTLRVVTLPRISYAPFYIAQEEGFFAEQALEIEFVKFSRSSEAIPALVQGQLDVVAGALSVSSLNAIARKGNIRLVAGKGYVWATGCT